MRKIIEDLDYTEPFKGSPLNRWLSPELDDIVARIQSNELIRTIVERLKQKFINDPEALAHGDLHTGSILVTEDDTRIIDTEFAIYAPISFDIGMLLANFVTAALSAPAHDLDAEWIAAQIPGIWNTFEQTFRQLWDNPDVSVDNKLQEIWSDTLRLIGIEIIRRTIGIAHIDEFETILERKLRAEIEQEALLLAERLILYAEDSFITAATLAEASTPQQP